MTAPDRYSPDAPAHMVERSREYIAEARWTFAKTMARVPHWYVIRRRARAAGQIVGHEVLYGLIREHGYDRDWYGRIFKSVDLDGWSYWQMDVNSTGEFLNCAPVGIEQDPAPTCHVHRGEPMTLDPRGRYAQWRCRLCDATAVNRR